MVRKRFPQKEHIKVNVKGMLKQPGLNSSVLHTSVFQDRLDRRSKISLNRVKKYVGKSFKRRKS